MLIYSFIISLALHLVIFVPWSTSKKVEKKRQETIPVSFKTIAKKETQPPAPKKAQDKPKRAKGLPQSSPPAVKPPAPPPPPPKPATQPQAVAQAAPPEPPPTPAPEPEPKVKVAKPPPPPPPPPVVKELAPAKDAKKPPKEKVVEKKPKPEKVEKKQPKPEPKKTAKKKQPVKKKKVAKKPPKKTKKQQPQKKKVAKKTPPQKATPPKKLPTLKELLPPLAGSGRVSGGHGNEYISMDSRDPKYSSWLASLQRDIYRTWLPSYPRANIRGEVLLGLMIEKDGDLAHVEVLRSSGMGLLDRHALEAVRAAAPFKRFPPWMDQSEQGIKATFTYGGTPGSVSNWSR